MCLDIAFFFRSVVSSSTFCFQIFYKKKGIPYEEYFSSFKLFKLFEKLNEKDFFSVHFNTRSLSKNKCKIGDFFINIQRMLEVTAVSETKLNSFSTSNVNIPNYKLLRNDSNRPTSVGGVCLHKDAIKFRVGLRNDLLLNLQHCEDLWIEVESKFSNFIFAVIYRHPSKKFLYFTKNFVTIQAS